jgi:hypothetical protein
MQESAGPQSTEVAKEATPQLPSLFAIVKFSDMKFVMVDDVLGLHLPIFQVFDQLALLSRCFPYSF